MELAMILFVSCVCGFSGGWSLNKAWCENSPLRAMFGCFLFAIGASSGYWIPLLHLFGE